MSIIEMLIVGMIIIIVATVTLAVLSYVAFRIRDRRAPRKGTAHDAGGPMFFERVRFAGRAAREE